jgi:hypothetical protein
MRWIVVAGVAACGGGTGADDLGFPRACDESSLDGDCILFSGEGFISADVTENCKGRLLPRCPTGDVGTCTVKPGEDFEAVTAYYPPLWDLDEATVACDEKGGTWLGP